MAKSLSMIDALHPYWRFEYAERGNKGAVDDPFMGLDTAPYAERLTVIKGKTAALILNHFPYAPGHLLAIPYRKVGEIEDLTPAESAELQELIVRGKLLLQQVLGAHATNIGLNQGVISGGSIPTHLHWHIVPRWQGDHSFLPIIGSTRLLPRSQQSVWKALRKAVEGDGKDKMKAGKKIKKKKYEGS